MGLAPFRQLRRQSLALLVDACIVVNAYTLAALTLFARWAPLRYYNELLIFIPFAVAVHCALNLKLGLYRAVGRYAGLNQALNMIRSSVLSLPILLVIGFLVMHSSLMRVLVMVPIGGAIAFLLMSVIRFYPRVFYERSLKEVRPRVRLLVVGAGAAGEMIVRSIQKTTPRLFEVVALVDDNPALQGMEIHGITIHGPTDHLSEIVSRKDIDEILIAMPSAALADFRRIVELAQRTGKNVKILRPLQSTHLGKVGVDNISDIEIEDLLGRQPVQTDYTRIRNFIKGKTVLVTGAGGSIGSELVNQISRHNPARIILLDQDESSLYNIHKELLQRFFHSHEVCIADIRSETRMAALFEKFRPELVFHAAAYKHVPMMELQPDLAVLNNVRGTWITARMAGRFGARCFVNISTDKAVEPVNVMGATKHLGERIVSELQAVYPATKFSSVRFGNVLGSRGSVLPIFREQIREGGPVTVTHPEMTRYFMLISEAVDLVLQAATFSEGDAVHVLNMGNPVRIVDLANQMIAQLSAEERVEVIFTGLRPGEKLYEQLIASDELHEATSHPMISRISSPAGENAILPELELLFSPAGLGDCATVKDMLRRWIPSYTPFDMSRVGSVEATGATGNAGVNERDLVLSADLSDGGPEQEPAST